MDFEITEKTLVEETVKYSFNLITDLAKSIGVRFTEKIKIKKAVKEYVVNYIHRHGKIKVLGMYKPIPLRTLYINVDVITPSYLNSYQSIEGLQNSFKETSKRRFHHHSSNRQPGLNIVNQEQYLNVLGGPGTGKSTFLKRIGLEALIPKKIESIRNNLKISKYEHKCIPVLIELKKLRGKDINLFKIIEEEFSNCNFPESESFVKKCLDNGKLLILLDGLDEVPSNNIDSVISHIQDFSDKYKKNRYITSCRTAFYNTYFKNFIDVEISDFDDEQIKQFSQNWFSKEYDLENLTSQRFSNLVFGKDHESTLELARTPLLLTFLCLTFDTSHRLPPNRSLLYRKALNILLERWAAEKRVHNEVIYKDFHPDIEIEMLTDIAFKLYQANKIFFTKDELLTNISQFFEKSLNINSSVNSSRILNAIEVQQGLLVQRASETYSFSHLTIQEYLTSYYYFSKTKVSELVNDHFFDPKWREVFLLLAGMSDVDNLLELLTQRLLFLLDENEEIIEYINWSQNIVIPSEDAELNLARRLFVLSVPLLFINTPKEYKGVGHYANYQDVAFRVAAMLRSGMTINYPEHLNSKRALNLITTFKSLPFLKSYPMKHEHLLIDRPLSGYTGSINKQNKRYLKMILDALGFDLKLHKLDFVKMKPLINYIEACELVIKCKEESLTVTKSAWYKTCNNMVVYPDNSN